MVTEFLAGPLFENEEELVVNHDVVEIRGSLMFDSWFEEVPLLRNASAEDRHLIYEGGGVILDLRVN